MTQPTEDLVRERAARAGRSRWLFCQHAKGPQFVEHRVELFLAMLPFTIADCRVLVAI